MTSMHAARLGGDDYQHLYSWFLALALKLPGEQAWKVTVEDKTGEKVDDVTVRYKSDATQPDCYYQIKFHIDQRSMYSYHSLITGKKGKSLLENFWKSWKKLSPGASERGIELCLLSNWAWDSQDALGQLVSGFHDRIKVDVFMAASSDSPIGQIRQTWQQKLQASDEDFKAFISCLYFQLGYSSTNLEKQVLDRMRWLQLKTDTITLKAITNIVRGWIKGDQHEIDLYLLNETLKNRNQDFYLPKEQERFVTIHMETVKNAKPTSEPDYHLDWVDLFVPDEKGFGGHQLKDPTGWNTVLRPQLFEIEKKISATNPYTLIKASGWSRLSQWFAFGYVFASVAGYTIEVDLPNQHWRTDVEANQDFSLEVTSAGGSFDGGPISGKGTTVVVGISAETSLDPDIRRYLETQTTSVLAVLLLQAKPDRLRNAGDAVALANIVKKRVSAFVRQQNASRLLLFYNGPAVGACFIGHRLNKVCPETQIMEYQPGQGYAPSFLLR